MVPNQAYYVHRLLHAARGVVEAFDGRKTADPSDDLSAERLRFQIMELSHVARSVPPSVRERFPDIPWNQMEEAYRSFTHFGLAGHPAGPLVHRILPIAIPLLGAASDELGTPGVDVDEVPAKSEAPRKRRYSRGQ